MNAATTSRFQSLMSAASRQRSARRRSMSSSSRSIRDGCSGMTTRVETGSDGQRRLPRMASRTPFRPGAGALTGEPRRRRSSCLLERGFTRLRDRLRGPLLDGLRLRRAPRRAGARGGIALSVHAPLAGFMGHAERGKKLNMAAGMLDHSAGIATACGAEVVVFHPGFLLGRTREEALDSVVRAARRAARAAGGQGPRGAVRGRGDGPRARARLARRRASRSRAGSAGCGR